MPIIVLLEMRKTNTATGSDRETLRCANWKGESDESADYRLKEIERVRAAIRTSRASSALSGRLFTVGGYRNDLIVRGGVPSENKFYLDGVEIPNINHFATQGASGGAVRSSTPT